MKGPPSTSYTPYDGNVGGGYGTLNPRFDINYQKGSVYPYVEPAEEYNPEEIEDIFGGDHSSIDKFVKMINKNFRGTDPSGRTDKGSFVSNQRIRLPESQGIPMRKGDPEHGSLSPIPYKTLYSNQTGPAIGIPSDGHLYHVGSEKFTGTQYGSTRAPLYFGSIETDPSDEIMAYTLEDILDQGTEPIKPVIRAKITVKNSVE